MHISTEQSLIFVMKLLHVVTCSELMQMTQKLLWQHSLTDDLINLEQVKNYISVLPTAQFGTALFTSTFLDRVIMYILISLIVLCSF